MHDVSVRARADLGETDSVRTGLAMIVASTLAVAWPLFAVRRTLPGATPVTRPAASMDAMAGASEVHSIAASARGRRSRSGRRHRAQCRRRPRWRLQRLDVDTAHRLRPDRHAARGLAR
jgi:hypothetical protein